LIGTGGLPGQAIRRPARLTMAFLDDAHRLGLLPAVAPVYQFRHTELTLRIRGFADCPVTCAVLSDSRGRLPDQ
jgi:hypothetical protein